MLRYTLISLWFVFCLVSLSFFSKKSKKYDYIRQNAFLVGLSSQAIDILTLGFKRVYEDYIFIDLLQDISSAKKKPIAASVMTEKINAIANSKISIYSFYPLTCFVLAYDYQTPQGCDYPIKVAMGLYPDNWYLPSLLGFMYTFKRADPLRGSLYYHLAGQKKGAPKYLSNFANKLKSEQVTKEDLKAASEWILNSPHGESWARFLKQR